MKGSDFINQELIKKYTEKDSYTFASSDEARTARRVYAYIRKNRSTSLPIYIQNGRHTYTRIELCTPQERADYFKREQAKWKSHYFDTLLPIKNELKREELEDMHVASLFERLERIFKNEEQ